MPAPNSGPGPLPDDENKPATEQGSIQSVGDPGSDVEDTADGGAIIKMDEPTPAPSDQGSFYDNLVDVIDPTLVSQLGQTLDELIRKDKEDRRDRDKKYAEGIQRTGLGDDAPGGATFQGASKAVHPVLIKASIDFEARAIAELMPPPGPVKEYIPTQDVTQAMVDKAKRKSAHMNWQLTKQMPEFRPELEQCLSQVSLGGSQFMYLNFDESRRRPVGTYWPSDDVLIPYGASSALMAERLTMVERISQRVYEKRIKTKYYVDSSSIEKIDSAPSMLPEQTAPAKAAEKVEGVKPSVENKDGLREIWRCFTELEIPDDKKSGGELAPYTIELTEDGHGVKRIVRNWEEKDDLKLAMPWLIEFPFLPWRGALSIGLGHAIGSLSGATTGALRALLDSAHINNFPALLKLKGANFSGQTKQIDVGMVAEIEGGVSGINDDIRKLMMAVPYNPTSPVLLELMGICATEAESVVQTTLKNLSEAASNTLPVGTTLALIEQGMKVFAGVHQRLLHAMTQLLLVLHRINKMYVTDEEIKDEAGTLLAMRSDYNGPMDVIPVADPNIFSDAQRFAQMQIVADRAVSNPDLYDRRKVEEMILERTRIPDATSLLVPAPGPKEDNAVNENAAMAMGQPVGVFPEQDHLAHLQVLLDFAQSPVLGQMPNLAPVYLPLAIKHAGDHIAMWYVQAFYHASSAAAGQDISKLMGTKNPEANAELDKLLATLSPAVVKQATANFTQIEQIMGQLQQIMQKYMPPQPPPDPSMAVAQVSAQTATAVADKRSQDIAGTNASREKVAQLSIVGKGQADQAATAAKAAADARLQSMKDAAAGDRLQKENLVKEDINQQDNQTALTIAAAELAGGHKSGVSTGTGINP